MKNEDFLDLLNEIDEKYIESANKRLEELHQYKDLEFGKALKPQVIRAGRTPKRRIQLRGAAFAAAAAVVCAVTVGVYVKLNKPQPSSPNSGVTLSEASGISEPFVSDLTSCEPVISESVYFTLTSPEPVSSEPPSTEEKLRRLEENDDCCFSLEIIYGDKEALYSDPILKTDSENEIAICFVCGRECEGRNFTIAFYLYDERYGITESRIATLQFTARNYTQWFTVPYKLGDLKEGDKCIMQLIPDDRDYTDCVIVKGKILP